MNPYRELSNFIITNIYKQLQKKGPLTLFDLKHMVAGALWEEKQKKKSKIDTNFALHMYSVYRKRWISLMDYCLGAQESAGFLRKQPCEVPPTATYFEDSAILYSITDAGLTQLKNSSPDSMFGAAQQVIHSRAEQMLKCRVIQTRKHYDLITKKR